MANEPRISVVTATWNVECSLEQMIESLAAASIENIKWVVQDNCSTDATLRLLRDTVRKYPHIEIDLVSEPDCGVYDALNKAVARVVTEYYLVVGADDVLCPRSIDMYKDAIASDADLVTARVRIRSRDVGPSRLPYFVTGQRRYISAHAVGVCIRVSLHDRFGYYDSTFRIAADQKFILSVIRGGASVRSEEFLAGVFSESGLSGANKIESLCESMLVKLGIGRQIVPSILVFVVRLCLTVARGHRR